MNLRISWLLACICFQAWGAGNDDLLAPLLEDQVRDLTLSPTVPPVARRAQPTPRASFELRDDDRILFLGDSLLEGELEFGYIETRLSAQFPNRHYTFRNYSKAAMEELAASKARFDLSKAPEEWYNALAAAAADWRPTVAIVSYGTDASLAGDSGVDGFQAALKRLLSNLSGAMGTNATRMVFLGPIAAEGSGLSPLEVAKKNEQLSHYSKAIESVVTDGMILLQLHGPLTNMLSRAASRRVATPTLPFFVTNQTHLTPAGYALVCLPLERALRWNAANWRFGFLPGGRFREGGFGIAFQHSARTDHDFVVEATEEILPIPNPPGYVEKDENARPQCYIQVPGLIQGIYTLQMDGKPVATGTHADWARYRLVTDGPQWDQAEQLRSTIVMKNELAAQLAAFIWKKASSQGVPDVKRTELEQKLREAEQEIQRLKRPSTRKMELLRTGDAPTPAKP